MRLSMRRRSSTIHPIIARGRKRAYRALLRDLVLSVYSRRHPGMFANILVPLDGSAMSEHALSMAQHLARSSTTPLHLLPLISLRPALEALHASRDQPVPLLHPARPAPRP